jgi:hypothetical protein
MTEYITKEQFQKMADEQGLVLHHTDQEKARRLINLAFEQRLEQRAYITKRGAIYGGKQTEGVTPLYALKGDSK